MVVCEAYLEVTLNEHADDEAQDFSQGYIKHDDVSCSFPRQLATFEKWQGCVV